MALFDKYKQSLSNRTERNLLYRLVHRLFYFHLTPAGRALFWVAILSTSLSLFSFVIKGYVVWCGLIAICSGSMLAARLARRKLDFSLDVPERVRHGQEFRINIKATNPGKRVVRDLRFQFWTPSGLKPVGEVAFQDELGPKESTTFSQVVRPGHRGAYLLDQLLQENCYPFGLWRDVKFHKTDHALLVYPKYSPLRELDIPVGMRYQPGGLALTSFLGDSTEFLSTREFRAGDPLRTIHWRSWARLGKPVVKEYGEEYFCRLALIMDTVVRDPEDTQPLELGISLAAAITDYLSRQEYVIDIFAAGPKLYYLQAGRSLAYLQNIMDVLACLEPTPIDDDSFMEMEMALLEEIEGISTTILIFTDWDDRRVRLLDQLKARGTAVRGFLVTNDKELAASAPDEVRWLTPEAIEGGIDVL